MAKDYNKDLRSKILICSIRCEEAASSALKMFLRTVRPSSKTLDNKSSSLSFKSKIDLLYDIEDLKIDDYNLMLKFMEIRNQFIHNPECNSFVDLTNIAKDCTNFLKKQLPNPIEDEEENLHHSFKELFTRVLGTLLILKTEYHHGIKYEMHKYVDSKALEKFKEIYSNAFQKWAAYKKTLPNPIYQRFPAIDNSEKEVLAFERYINLEIIDEKLKILDAISNKDITEKEVFKRKVDLMENLKKEKDEVQGELTHEPERAVAVRLSKSIKKIQL